jgi:hypothetical protein
VDRVIGIMVRKLGELSNFLIFNSGDESLLNSHRFDSSFDAEICPEYSFSNLGHRQKIITTKPLAVGNLRKSY